VPTVLYQRRARVIISGLLIEGLRTQFKVKKTLKKEPNEGEVAIYNLSPEHRVLLQKKGVPFILEAGYGSDLRRLFSGDVRFGDSVREGPDWISKIQSGDGENAYRFAQVSEGFGKGTQASAVFQRVANATGLDVRGAIASVAGKLTRQFTQGYSAHGKASTEIDRVLKDSGLEWSIQDGKLQVLPSGQPLPGEAIVLTSSSGLIGSPEHGTPEKKEDTPFLKVKCLLQPLLTPGGLVRVEARSVKGNFRIETVTHQGDTFGQDFYSDLELRPL
jgi:hypothetical protein